jgi:hypothetical protein
MTGDPKAGMPLERNDSIDRRTDWIALGILTILAGALRLACVTGLVGSDDLGYSGFAQAIANGIYRLQPHHFAIRFGLLLPVAVVYKLFGVSEWSTIALPLFASTLSVLLLAVIGQKLFGMRAGLMAGILYATFPVQLRYASILTPEPIAECFVLVAVLCYVCAENRPRFVYFTSGIAVGVAYLTKEPALFVAPALLLDAVMRRRWQSAALVAAGVTAIVSIEHAYYLAHGDLLFRPHAMAIHEASEMALAANSSLSYRLFKVYPRMMLIPGVDFGLHSIACLTLAAVSLMRGPLTRYRLLLAWAIIPWAYLNFGSSSLTRYFALPVAPRYIEFTYPPLMLMTGVGLSLAFYKRARTAPAAIALGLVAAIGLWSGLSTKGRGYRAAQMSVLREIARQTEPGARFRVDQSQTQWREALKIFGKNVSDHESEADWFVGPDPIGLPVVVRLR